jgi:hypothetical protein
MLYGFLEWTMLELLHRYGTYNYKKQNLVADVFLGAHAVTSLWNTVKPI